MKICKIELEGYSSYRNYCSVNIPNGITGIVGIYDENENKSNGVGKSAIVMSIIYAHYGKGEFDKLEEIINDDPAVKTMYVKITEEISGNQYVVERGLKGKSSYLDFYENGVRLGNNIDSTQLEINRVLGMDYDMFSSSVFFEQAGMDKFVNTTSDKRKSYIDKVFGSKMWRDLGKETNTENNKLKDGIKSLLKNKEVIKVEIDETKKNILDKVNTESLLNSKKIQMNDISEEMNRSNEYKSKVNEIDSKKKVINNLYAQLNNIVDIDYEMSKKTIEASIFSLEEISKKFKEDLNKLLIDIQNIEKDIVNVSHEKDSLLKDKNELLGDLSKLHGTLKQVIAGTCPTCLQEVNKDLLNNHNSEIKNDLGILEKSLKEKEEAIQLITLNIVNMKNNSNILNTERMNIVTNISKTDNDIDLNKSKLNLLDRQFKENEKQKATITSSLNGLEEELKILLEHMNNLNGIYRDTKILNTEFTFVSKEIEELNRSLGKIEQTEKQIENLGNKLKICEDNLKLKELEAYLNNTLIEAYSIIPSQILEESITSIQTYANDIIQQIIPDLQVKIYEDLTKTRKPLIISFLKKGRNRNYKRLSGGERTIVNIAIRLGFCKEISYRASTHIGFVCLDEPFGALDEENRNLVKEIFSVLSNTFNQILIITHTEDSSNFPSLITVRKDKDDISYII